MSDQQPLQLWLATCTSCPASTVQRVDAPTAPPRTCHNCGQPIATLGRRTGTVTPR